METITELLRIAREAPSSPCLSLYQPTHRTIPERAQDRIRFRNLLKTLAERLRAAYPDADAEALLAPYRALAEDERYWASTLDGLAVFGAAGFFRAVRLQRPVPERAVVADTFHLKPLLRIQQSADRYQVLGLSRDAAKLFEGNRDVLDEVELHPEAAKAIDAALDEERKEPHVSIWTYRAAGPQAGAGVQHGTGGEKDQEQEIEHRRFFRAVDRAILEHHSRPSGLPLLLAALPENQAAFRALSRNPFLLDGGRIDADPDALSRHELRRRVWQVLEPHYLARLAGLVDMFGAARARALGADALPRVAEAAAAGRVATLLVEAEREIPGHLDRATGAVSPASGGADDLLDDVAELALEAGGQVIVVPSARMPTQSGVAAIYRY